ncbi:retrovirus-related Pol polyprotein from transposon opus [Nephila pilipes]|uniref:Retrovirus-related Pol polyprotein from transposon opus n=1 Tax=Nephila pilipes TaxID=299642 RepID=A0A8X6NPD9_NEPPI|nr:retrovirus-related Pol polyprotein from transposon opus [Nephila pilipes]GFT23483.1 retrovirus-related Pol polyprotein from transposon opus [Nephila pilipes]
MYGTNIKLPGKFFGPPTIKMDQETFVSQLQKCMEELKPELSRSTKKYLCIKISDPALMSVRIDRIKKALEPSYQGPYRVVERSENFFTLSMKNKNVNISFDRLKPAYLLVTDKDDKLTPGKQTDGNLDYRDSHLQPDNQTISRCGRQIKQPVRFRD